MINWIIKKIIGSKNQREIRRLQHIVRRINEAEAALEPLSDDALRLKTLEWKDRLSKVEDNQQLAAELEALLPEAFAVVKSGARRLSGRQIIVCDQPLTSQLGEHSCVYYRMSVRRKYDEEYWEKDNNGNQVRKTRTGTDVVSDTKESCPFYVKDETGKLLVVPDGAKFDSLIESVSRFEPATMGGLGGIGFGRFQLTPPMMQGSGRRTLGYHYEEHVLPLNRRVTIMGQVNDKMGQLAMRKADGQKLFISTRSKEEMVGSAQKTAQVMFASAIGSAVIGVVLAIIGAVS